MHVDDVIGRVCRLPVKRLGNPGAYLAIDPKDAGDDPTTVLLPRRQVSRDVKVGDVLEVFIHLDSDDRAIASTTLPRLALGEVVFLEVTDVAHFGAFFDWGLPKELLVPNGAQTRDLVVGERHPIGLVFDDTQRLAGTMRVTEMLRRPPSVRHDQWVEGEAWRKEPGLGLFVIVARRFVALVPESEPHTLERGDAASFRVARVLEDGKVELSLRRHAHEELESDAQHLLAALRRGPLRLGDRSSPDEIRAAVGLSKKAFKRGVGRLLKRGLIELDGDGIVVLRG